MSQHEIRTLADLLELTPAQLLRALPDLVEWHAAARAIAAPGVENTGFVWTDDGERGIASAELTDPVGGCMERICLRLGGATYTQLPAGDTEGGAA